jgi:uncharacterized protein with HEPN domain
MSRDHGLYLRDILASGGKIRSVTETHFFHEFTEEWMARDAVARNFELIGEAVRRLPRDLLARAPEVEWEKFLALRKILLHAYFRLDDAILWDAAVNKLPALVAAAQRLLDFYEGGS